VGRINFRILDTPLAKGIIWGIIVAIMLMGFRVPPGFALMVGIIIGVVAGFVLDTSNCSP